MKTFYGVMMRTVFRGNVVLVEGGVLEAPEFSQWFWRSSGLVMVIGICSTDVRWWCDVMVRVLSTICFVRYFTQIRNYFMCRLDLLIGIKYLFKRRPVLSL
jgi:hypothetical protein